LTVAGGLTSSSGASIQGGLTVQTGGIVVSANGLTVTAGGFSASGGMTITGIVSTVGLTVASVGVRIAGQLSVAGTVFATGSSSTSDRRLKRRLLPVVGALEKVSRLNGVYFNWIESMPGDSEERHIGFIAQEVFDVIPEVVDTKSDYLSMDYTGIVPLLVEAVKELRAEDLKLRKELELLQSKLKHLLHSI
jgi:hypothetical protein